MLDYAIGLDKIDVARGRSVPAPPYGTSNPSKIRGNLTTITGQVYLNI